MIKHPSMSLIDLQACLVCGGRGDGAHFGAKEACRACAAFFRRTVSLDKTYSCRADGNCLIEASVRCMCRACRFEKCLLIGMQKANVQRRRDHHGPRRRSEEPDSSLTAGPSQPMFISEEQGMPMLRRLHTHHMQLRAVRKVVHRGGELIQPFEPKQVQLHDVDQINLREVSIVADFVLAAYPDLNLISSTQKKVLYQLFFPSFIILECGFRTSRSNTPHKIVLANEDFIDTQSIIDFYIPKHEDKPVQTKEAVSLFSPSFQFFLDHIAYPFKSMGLDDYEFYALATFMLWDYDHEKITPDTRMVAEQVRERLIKELVFYYKYIKRVPDDQSRLAHVLLMLPALIRMTRRFVEDIEMSRVFNIYSIDSLTFDIINLRAPNHDLTHTML